jgi:hypothetical protein
VVAAAEDRLNFRLTRCFLQKLFRGEKLVDWGKSPTRFREGKNYGVYS